MLWNISWGRNLLRYSSLDSRFKSRWATRLPLDCIPSIWGMYSTFVSIHCPTFFAVGGRSVVLRCGRCIVGMELWYTLSYDVSWIVPLEWRVVCFPAVHELRISDSKTFFCAKIIFNIRNDDYFHSLIMYGHSTTLLLQRWLQWCRLFTIFTEHPSLRNKKRTKISEG